MARIIDSVKRRLIKLTADDVITIVKEYQKLVPRNCSYEEIRNYLTDAVIFIPEDI